MGGRNLNGFRSRRGISNAGINTSMYIVGRINARGVLTAHWRPGETNEKAGRFTESCSILETYHTARRQYQSSNFTVDMYESDVTSDREFLRAHRRQYRIYGDPPILSSPKSTVLPGDTRFRASSLSFDNGRLGVGPQDDEAVICNIDWWDIFNDADRRMYTLVIRRKL